MYLPVPKVHEGVQLETSVGKEVMTERKKFAHKFHGSADICVGVGEETRLAMSPTRPPHLRDWSACLLVYLPAD